MGFGMRETPGGARGKTTGAGGKLDPAASRQGGRSTRLLVSSPPRPVPFPIAGCARRRTGAALAGRWARAGAAARPVRTARSRPPLSGPRGRARLARPSRAGAGRARAARGGRSKAEACAPNAEPQQLARTYRRALLCSECPVALPAFGAHHPPAAPLCELALLPTPQCVRSSTSSAFGAASGRADDRLRIRPLEERCDRD